MNPSFTIKSGVKGGLNYTDVLISMLHAQGGFVEPDLVDFVVIINFGGVYY